MLILNTDEGKPARGARERRSGGGGGNDRKGEKNRNPPLPSHTCLSIEHDTRQGPRCSTSPGRYGNKTGKPRFHRNPPIKLIWKSKAFSWDLLSNKARHKIYRGHLGTSYYLRIYGNDN